MLITKSFPVKLSIDATEDTEVTFTGLAAPFNVPDSLGDVIRPQCFTKSLGEGGSTLPLLWNHSASEPLGVVTASVDEKALNVTGRLLVAAVAKAAEVAELVRVGGIRGLSVGFLVIRKSALPSGGTQFEEARLCEVSLTPVPAFHQAQVVSVHHLAGLDKSTLLTLKSAIDGLLNDPTEEESDLAELVKAFRTFPKKRRLGTWG